MWSHVPPANSLANRHLLGWAEALICRISLQLTVLPSVSSITGCIMATPFLRQKSSRCHKSIFSFIFCCKSFVDPPSCLHFTVEAIKVTEYNAVMKQAPAKNKTVQEHCPKIICPCPRKCDKLVYTFNFVWRITLSFFYFFRQYSCEVWMAYDLKIVIHTFRIVCN